MSVRRSLTTFALGAVISGCGGATMQDVSLDDGDKADGTSQTIKLSATSHATVTLTSTGTAKAFTVDCGVPSNPDQVGVVFSVNAPDLGQTSRSDDRAGYFRWTGTLPAGNHTIILTGKSGSASCKVSSAKLASSCSDSLSWHSPNTNHTHFRVGTDTSSDWESFPASGNHWGAWAAWGKEYDQPVKRAYTLHNLEHGGLVLSYKCASATSSAECRQAAENLSSAMQSFGEQRVILTPDPGQPSLYAVRGWRWAYTAECFDSSDVEKFMSAHFRHGREDADADPPIPFDPTTTNVPCQDLMAAPDSCN